MNREKMNLLPEGCGFYRTGLELARGVGQAPLPLLGAVREENRHYVLCVEPMDEGVPLEDDIAAMLVDDTKKALDRGSIQYFTVGQIPLVPPVDLAWPKKVGRLAVFAVELGAVRCSPSSAGHFEIMEGHQLRFVCWFGEGSVEEVPEEALWEEFDSCESLAVQRGLVARSIGTQLTHDPERRDAIVAALKEDREGTAKAKEIAE